MHPLGAVEGPLGWPSITPRTRRHSRFERKVHNNGTQEILGPH